MAQVPLPTPTDNEVPSTDIRDAVYAGAMLDKVVTSRELTYTARDGSVHVTVDGMKAEGDEVVEETRQNLIPLSRQYMTLAAAQADIANIPPGSATYVRSADGSSLADEYINNGGTLESTGRKMPSQATITASIDKDEDQSLSKSLSLEGVATEIETESGERFLSGMDESIQELASRSGKDNTGNLHSVTDKAGLQLVITDAEGKIRIPLSDFTLQDLLAQVQPVSGPFLNTLSAADKAAYGYIDELGGLNLPGIPTSVNNMLNSLSRRVQQQADSRFLTSIKDYSWDPSSQEDARQVIQRAIRDMARNPYGGVIYLPPGVYRLSSFLTPAPNVSIIGAGTGKTILMPYGSYSALQFTTSPTNPIPELTDFVYSDFEVDCQDQVLPDEGYLPRTKGLYFNFYRRGHLNRLRVRNSGATGIGIDFARDSAISGVWHRRGMTIRRVRLAWVLALAAHRVSRSMLLATSAATGRISASFLKSSTEQMRLIVQSTR